MAQPAQRMNDADQKRANGMVCSLLENLLASLRDGRADVLSASSTNGLRVAPDGPEEYEQLEYDGGGRLEVTVELGPGLFWIDGHPFERRGDKPTG